MALKIPTSSIARPSKIYPKLDFWFENIHLALLRSSFLRSNRFQKFLLRISLGTIRVTRLGEFLPIVSLFGRFLKITQVAQILRLPFQRQKLCINFDENLIGLHFWSPWRKCAKSEERQIVSFIVFVFREKCLIFWHNWSDGRFCAAKGWQRTWDPFLTSPLGTNFDPQGRSCRPGVKLDPGGGRGGGKLSPGGEILCSPLQSS
jgi:hypothetical protein